MDPWEAYREKHLQRLEEALKKGEVDPPAVPLLKVLNSYEGIVTTSSCSGRVILLATSKEEDKASSYFHRKWHRPVMVEEVLEGVNSFQGDVLWFKVDPLIFHVAAKDLEIAYGLVKEARKAGVKIAGIQVIEDYRVNVEVRGIDSMALPLFWDGEKIVNDGYLRSIVPIANRKMVKNQQRLEKLFDVWKAYVEKLK